MTTLQISRPDRSSRAPGDRQPRRTTHPRRRRRQPDRLLYGRAEPPAGGCLFGDPDPEPFGPAIEQLDEYFSGERQDFDLPLAVAGTTFQQRVWAALREIPYGETESYGELAARIGSPGASRAVGLANGRNPIGIIVPCHRVIGASGSLTGYGGGIERKRQLLDMEREVLWRNSAG